MHDNKAVLLDFGAAREVLSKEGNFIRPMYTPGFAAPEMYRRDGSRIWISESARVVRAPSGQFICYEGTVQDITERHQAQEQIRHRALHDDLTGLPSRAMLLEKLNAALALAERQASSVGLLFIDLNGFKQVNDTYGHDAGDHLLRQFAQELKSALRSTDVLGRWGGDEFVVLCGGGIDQHIALDLAERIRHALSGRTMLNGVEVDLSVSIGVAVSSAADVDGLSNSEAAIDLLRNADTAMYQAKRRGRSRSEMYSDEMRAESRIHKQLAGQLEKALAAGELSLAYQPIISAHTNRVVGAEALLRWTHPERGLLMPAQFLHLAEESGAIVPIGDWVTTQACTDTRAWLDAGLVDRTFSVHVNVAARQLAEGTFVERTLATVRQLELNPQQLTLDFEESTLNDQQPGTMRSLQALRRFGVQLALDSFGTGVSSLTALRTCEADVLKLDGSVARLLGASGDDDPIVRSIIQLAHALDMQVVAEWVSSADQLRRLRVLGCDLVQGHLLGEPTAAELFASRVRL